MAVLGEERRTLLIQIEEPFQHGSKTYDRLRSLTLGDALLSKNVL